MLLHSPLLYFVILSISPVALSASAKQDLGSTLQSSDVSSIPGLMRSRISWKTSHVSHSRPNLTIEDEANCFHQIPLRFDRANAEDCMKIVDAIVSKYPDPFATKSWGYSTKQDIDLSLEENSKWFYGECVIFVRSMNTGLVDYFRTIDVAIAAQEIIEKCVRDTKSGYGGTADLGVILIDGFYVVVGGLDRIPDKSAAPPSSPNKDMVPSIATNRTVLSLSRNTERSLRLAFDESG